MKNNSRNQSGNAERRKNDPKAVFPFVRVGYPLILRMDWLPQARDSFFGLILIVTMPKPSIILIRETEEQVAGSGCCGKFEGDFARCGGEWIFPERRQIKESMGEIARYLKKEFGDAIDLTVVDPRNQLYLFPKIVRDVWLYRPPVGAALRSLCLAFAFPAVLVNGQVKFSRCIPEHEEILQVVLAAIPIRFNSEAITGV
jgi:hypothetical protein